MKKTIATILAVGTLGAGGTFAADKAINPYVESSEKLEIIEDSVIDYAGKNEVEVIKDWPEVRFKKWDGEVDIGVRYDNVKAKGDRVFMTDRVEWEGGKEEVHAYPLDAKVGMEDGGFEIEVILNEKPNTNIFEFAMDGHSTLNFYYQAGFDKQREAEFYDCTPTQCIDENGDIVAEMPENVVGSYAVYGERANHCVNCLQDKNYATGKVMHIFRPKAIDADGNEQWSELHYENGKLTVTVPQNFLDKATYPVRVDPTFGKTSVGSSSFFISKTIRGDLKYLKEDGDLTAISAYLDDRDASNEEWTIAMYNGSGAVNTWALATSTPNATVAANFGPDWTTTTFAIPQSVTKGFYYLLIACRTTCGSADLFMYADNTQNDARDPNVNSSANPWSDPATLANTGEDARLFGRFYSFYGTYTATCDPSISTCAELFMEPGYNTWTAPTGVTTADVACWGAGGGGGVLSNSGGGGGGGGAFASSTMSVTAGNTYAMWIGSGGLPNTATWARESSFASTTCPTCVIAAGGLGVGGSTTGGTGGPTASSTGTTKSAGGNGGAGNGTGDAGGGGGGAAGPHGAGGTGADASTTVGGGGGGGNGGSAGSGSTGGSSTNGGAGGTGDTNGSTAPSGNLGGGSVNGGGGGGGGGDDDQGGPGGEIGGGGGGGEVGSTQYGAHGACMITYTSAGGGGGTPDASPAVFYFKNSDVRVKNSDLRIKR